MKTTSRKTLMLIMAILLALNCVSLNVFAVENAQELINTEPKDEIIILEENELPEILRGSVKNHSHVERLKDDEKEQSLDTLVFKNANRTNTMYLFSEAVKYIDEDGVMKDKSNEIIETGNDLVPLKNKYNDVKIAFGKDISNGVSVEYKDYSITITPLNISDTAKAPEKINSKTGGDDKLRDRAVYNDVFGEGRSLLYTPAFSGIKEDIVITQYDGVSEYSFILNTNGLKIVENDNSFELYDVNAEKTVGSLNSVIAYDSEHKASAGALSVSKVEECQAYEITVFVDPAFMGSPDTVYPVYVDPGFRFETYTGSTKNIVDAQIVSSYPNTNFGSASTNLTGYDNSVSGVSRTLYGFPCLSSSADYTGLVNADIHCVLLNVKETYGASQISKIKAYRFTGNTWSESSVTYSNVQPNSYDTAHLCTKTISSNGTVNAFDITEAAKAWKTGADNKGVILINENESSSNYLRGFVSTESPTDKPFLSVYYSDLYNSDTLTADMALYSDESKLQLRANCYSYALRMFYAGIEIPNLNSYDENSRGYLLNTGEFIDKTNGYTITAVQNVSFLTYNNLNTIYNNDDLAAFLFALDCGVYIGGQLYELEDTSTVRTEAIYELVSQDMAALGYNIERIDISQNNYVAPDAVSGKRLIALVASTYGFHFYMQTGSRWSHKPGNTTVSTKSLATNVTLTNSNIYQKSRELFYLTAPTVIFFYIDKPETIDYGYLDGYYSGCVQTQTISKDQAGNAIETGIFIGSTSEEDDILFRGRIDYKGDNDHLYFRVGETGSYHIVVSESNEADYPIVAQLYDGSINLISQTTATYLNSGEIIYNLNENEEYCLVISGNMLSHSNDLEYFVLIC